MQSYEKISIFASLEGLFLGIFCGVNMGSKYFVCNLLKIRLTNGLGGKCKICVCRQKAVILHNFFIESKFELFLS